MRAADDGAQAALRKKAKREQQAEAENQACRAVETSLYVQRDGIVRLLARRSRDRYWLEEKRKGASVSLFAEFTTGVTDSDGSYRTVGFSRAIGGELWPVVR